MNIPQKKYECQACGELFSYYANKIKHETQCVNKQEEKRSNLKSCPHCSVEYANEISLKRHLWNCIRSHEEAPGESKDCEDFDKLNFRNNFKKKWKFCFFDNCYSTFYHISHLIKHIYSSHDDTLKYGIQMLEFSSMDEFARWMKLESMRTNSSFIVRTNTKKYISFVCQHDNLAMKKIEKRWSRGVVKKSRICMSRILVIKNDNNVICTYMNVHTHDLKLNNTQFQQFDREFYNKIKSYICLGVDVNEIYSGLIENSSDEAEILYFKEHFRYAKKNIAQISRELRMKLRMGDISNTSIEKSDDDSYDSIAESMETDHEIEEEDQPIKRKRKSESDQNNDVDEKTLNSSLLSSVELTQPVIALEKSSNKVVLLKKLGNDDITILPISQAKVFGFENLAVEPIKPMPIEISTKISSSCEPNVKEDQESNEQPKAIKIDNQFTPLNVIKKKKASAIKKQIAIIDKYIDDTYLESDLDYFMKLVDNLLKKCKFTDSINDLLNDKSQLLKDSSSVILKYLKYTNDLQENILFLNNNKIIISMVDLLTLVSPASSKPITYLCKKADPTFQDGRLTETIIDAFCFRLSQMSENKMYIFGNTNLGYQLLSTEHGEQFFANINYKNKSHLFLPVHCNEVWTLIVFNLEHALYGYLNSVKVNSSEHERSIKKIIERLKIILPNETWKQMTFLSVYPKNAERSGVFICFYLECLTKKLPLMTPMKVHRFRLSIFNVIRGNCLREPKIEDTTCVVCKSLIIPLSMRVRCKECLICYHYDCIKLGNVDEFVCNDLKEIM